MKKLKHTQSRQRQFTSFLDGMKIKSAVDQSIIHQEEDDINRRVLKQVLDALTQREREVLFLKYYEGMSYSEIEEILGIEYQSARNYMYRAIKRLRKVLKERELKLFLF